VSGARLTCDSLHPLKSAEIAAQASAVRLRKAEASSFPKPRLKVKSVMAVRCDLKSDLYRAGVEFANKSVFALLPDVVPNQNAQAPVQAVPSEPSMISSGGLSTTVVS